MEVVKIIDSYKISKWEMSNYLDNLRKTTISDVFKRNNTSLIFEWATHNLLYNLHIAKERTKDVDLEYPQK